MKLKDVDLTTRMKDKKEYRNRLSKAQLQLLLIQRFMFQHQREAVILFEGWDAGGKGGSIRRLIEYLDPRGYVVHPIAAPTSDEKHVHYLQRFWKRMPGPGSIGIFDRTWYGRVLVERIEGYATKSEWKRAYGEINTFEKLLTDDGVPVLKYFLHITPEEQLKRFEEREKNPFKNWKITEDDYRNREKWDEYEKAINAMLAKTGTEHAPWTVVAGEHKWCARVQVCETAVELLSKALGCDVTLPKGWRTLHQ